jgi:hypothetical protein
VCEEHMQWYWSLLTGVSSRFDGRGSGSSPIGMCVWPAPFKITGTSDRFRFDGEALRKSGIVCLTGPLGAFHSMLSSGAFYSVLS